MQRTCSILLAEPNELLREKMAGILSRQAGVWGVLQVASREGMCAGAEALRPDLILVDLALLQAREPVLALRRIWTQSRILLLVDSDTGPYHAAAERWGFDGVLCKAHVAEAITREIDHLLASGETWHGQSA
jgi:DNA-binding NarL/FixJ family response regulator